MVVLDLCGGGVCVCVHVCVPVSIRFRRVAPSHSHTQTVSLSHNTPHHTTTPSCYACRTAVVMSCPPAGWASVAEGLGGFGRGELLAAVKCATVRKLRVRQERGASALPAHRRGRAMGGSRLLRAPRPDAALHKQQSVVVFSRQPIMACVEAGACRVLAPHVCFCLHTHVHEH